MIQAALTLLLLAAAPDAAPSEPRLAPLMDNSFLIEEAYNQEAGVVQQILTAARDAASGGWVASFTQEWPVPARTHQLSYTFTWARERGPDGHTGLGDVALNYRYQAIYQEDRVAVAPRLTLLVPGGAPIGFRGPGLQALLPVSTTLTPWLVTHANLGATWVPDGRSDSGATRFVGYTLGQSLVWLPHPRLNVLCEVVWAGLEQASHGATTRSQAFTVSPGVRWGIDLPGELQVVLGLAAPLGVGPSAGEHAAFGYLSVELPFWHPAEGAE